MKIEQYNTRITISEILQGSRFVEVITLEDYGSGFKVGSSMCLPTNVEHAKKVLTCYNYAFKLLEEMSND